MSFKRIKLLYLDKLSYIIFVVLILVIKEEDIEKVLSEKILYLLSKLLAILQTCIINIESTCFYLCFFISFFITL